MVVGQRYDWEPNSVVILLNTDPWAKTILVHYNPDLRFHERKVSLLRSFDDLGLLRAYRLADNEAGALLGHGRSELVITERYLRLYVTPQSIDEDIDLERRVVQDVMTALSPEVTEFEFLSQHVCPLEGEYEINLQESASRFFGSWATDNGMRDYALLLDGSMGQRDYKAEFGIITDDELEPRLLRKIGRIRPRGSPSPYAPLGERTPPSVALFIDISWHQESTSLEESIDASQLLAEWTESVNLSQQVVENLYSMLLDGSDRSKESGEA